MVTLEDVKNNAEVMALIEGSQKQLDKLRIHRTREKAYSISIKKSRRNIGKASDMIKEWWNLQKLQDLCTI